MPSIKRGNGYHVESPSQRVLVTSGHVRAREDESGVAAGLAGLHHARRRLRVVSVIYPMYHQPTLSINQATIPRKYLENL